MRIKDEIGDKDGKGSDNDKGDIGDKDEIGGRDKIGDKDDKGPTSERVKDDKLWFDFARFPTDEIHPSISTFPLAFCIYNCCLKEHGLETRKSSSCRIKLSFKIKY